MILPKAAEPRDDHTDERPLRHLRDWAQTLAWQMVGHSDPDAEDFAVEAFLAIWTHPRRDALLTTDRPLAECVARATILDCLRRRRRGIARRLVPLSEAASAQLADRTSLSHEDRIDLLELIAVARAKMGDAVRAAFEAMDIDELPWDEAAARLGCPKATLWHRLVAARAVIRRLLGEGGG